MPNFVQIDPDDWESGPYLPVAVIAPLPEELKRGCNIKLHEILEDLGLVDIAFIELPDGARYIFNRYRDNPGPGTMIHGLKDVPDIAQSVRSLLQCIGVDQSDLWWVAEE